MNIKNKTFINLCLKSGIVLCAVTTVGLSTKYEIVNASSIVASPGATVGSTKLTLTPLNAGDKFDIVKSSSPLASLPVQGAALPGGTVAYTSGSDITGVDPTTNKYIDVYEVDSSSKIVAEKEITVTASQLNAFGLTTAPSAAAGTVAGSTKLTLTPNTVGDTWKVAVVSKPSTLPVLGSTAPATASSYTSGNDITGVDQTTNKYVDVYEIDGSGKVAAFKEVTLTGANITAPSFKTAPVSAVGVGLGATKLTLATNVSGDKFYIVKSNSALGSLPVQGAALPGGAVAYTSGNDIIGVDPTTNKYIDVYEVDSSSKVVSAKEITVTASQLNASSVTTAPSAAAGTVAGSTKLTLTPNTVGDTWKVAVVSKPSTLPVLGSTAPASASSYTSGNDITGVDQTTNKYVDVYEIDGSGKVAAFKEVTLTGANITAPSFKTVPVSAVGAGLGTTKLTLTANVSGDKFYIVKSSSTLASLPVQGAALPGGAVAYTSGNDITGVDPTTNKYIDVYEVDSSSKVVSVKEITVTASQLNASSVTTAPSAAAGTVAGSTKLTLTPNTVGDTWKVAVVSKPSTLPVLGSTAPATASSYTSGNDITGVDQTNNKYVDVYEIDGSGKVAAFKEVTLTGANITAPSFKTAPVSAVGVGLGATKLTLAANVSGDKFYIVKSSSVLASLPVQGAALPGGAVAYTSGNDITGVDPTTNKYIDVYEVDSSSKVVSVKEITVTASQLNASSVTTAPSASAGTVAGSTKLTLTPNTVGDTWKVAVVSKPSTLPVLGSTVPASASSYTSGNDITGVDQTTNKYVDVYEIDGSGKVAAFKEVTLTGANITAPSFKTAPVSAVGTGLGATKLTLAANVSGDKFFIVKSSSTLASLPVQGAALPGGAVAYTSGNDITGVDPTTNKYIDVYEVDSSSKVVSVKEITVTASQLNASSVTTAPSAATGTVAGSTKLTLTPNTVGDTWKVAVVSKPSILPVLGSTAPASASSYTSGNDITGVDQTTNKYVDVYEIDGSGKVAAFKEVTLTGANITAPSFKTAPVSAVGAGLGATKLTLAANVSGDKFYIVKSSSALGSLPVQGAALPGGAVAYTSGNDITGVDPTTNKYIDIYEVDSSSKVVSVKEITVTASQLNASSITTAPSAAAGTVAGSTKLTLTPNTVGDTWKVAVVSKPSTLPVLGSTAPATASSYTSGNDITGVDQTTNKYVDVYEIDGSGKVAAFKEVALTGANITAPSL